MAFVKKIVGILLLVFGALEVAMCLNIMWTSMDTPLGVGDAIGSIIIVFVICGLPGCLMLYFSYRLLKNTVIQMVRTARTTKESKRQSKAERRESTKNKQKQVKIKYYCVRHMGGLELPENILCTAYLFNDQLLISSDTKTYTLPIDKLRGLDYSSDINIQQYITSSTARGIIGAAAFGVAGAVIGSAPKTKEKATIKGSVIIQYQSAEEIKYMVFQDNMPNDGKSYEIYKMLHPLVRIQQPECIDL